MDLVLNATLKVGGVCETNLLLENELLMKCEAGG